MEFGKNLCHAEGIKGLESDRVYDACVLKVYHVYKRRNEWVNWSGDTSLMKRTNLTFTLTIREAEDLAEKYRNRGTKFIIDETPAICVFSEKRSLIVTDLFERAPVFQYNGIINLTKDTTLADVSSSILSTGWRVKALYSGNASFLQKAKRDETYYSWTSYPAGSGYRLGWSAKTSDISADYVKRVVKKMRISLRNAT